MPTTEPPLLSIVIPVLNEAASLEAFLGRLASAFPDAEVILVDGGSDDATVAISLRAGAVVLMSDPGRAVQMNLGAATARGAWLLFLHADCGVPFSDQALYPCLEATNDNAEWGFFDVRLEGRSRLLPIIARMMNLRSRMTRVATGDQGLFLRTRVFHEMSGFASIPLMEDVEICKRLRRKSAPLNPGLTLTSSGRRWDEQGAWPTILRMWTLRLAYWAGVSPQRLWRYYYGDKALTPDSDGSEVHG